jgi:hypothetical protein
MLIKPCAAYDNGHFIKYSDPEKSQVKKEKEEMGI